MAQTLASLKGKWGMEAGNLCVILFSYHSGGTPFGGWRHHLCPGGKHVTGFSGRCASLQIQFLCHPAKAGALWTLGISGNLSLWQLQRENHTTGLRPWKCTPSAAFGGVSPGGGDFSGAMPCDTYEAEWEAESKLPPPGEVPPQAGIGVHFYRAVGAVGLFSFAR